MPSGVPYQLVGFRCTRKSPKISILGGQWHDVQNSSTQIDNKEQCANSPTKGAILVNWAREEVSERFYRKRQLSMHHLHLLWTQNQGLDGKIFGLFTSSKVRWRKRRRLCVEKTCSISWENRRHFAVTFVRLFAQMSSSDTLLPVQCIDFLFVRPEACQDCTNVIDARLVSVLWVKTWRQHDLFSPSAAQAKSRKFSCHFLCSDRYKGLCVE